MIYNSTRRDFLATTSLSVLGSMVAAPLHAMLLDPGVLKSNKSANDIFPESLVADQLKSLASAAVEAAKAAGAEYADIRIGEQHRLEVSIQPSGPGIEMHSKFTFGVRALVDGAWAFVHGDIPSTDSVIHAARHAVSTARGYSTLIVKRGDLPSTPLAKGSWDTPIKIDPFTIPIADQVDLLYGIANAGLRVLGGGREHFFNWQRELRVFASTEGSLATQTLRRAWPHTKGKAAETLLWGADVLLKNYGPASAGYEAVLLPDLQEQLQAATEQAARLSTIPFTTMDVGRYPVILDGFSLATLFGSTVGQALQLDRALGLEADASGTSFLMPPGEILGKTVINPALSVRIDRSLPSVHAVKWDDDGVVPEPTDLIKDGVVVDYCSSRTTASRLSDWYQKQGKPVKSTGCALSPNSGDAVMIRSPHLVVAPNPGIMPLEGLYKDVKQGLLLVQAWRLSSDQQLTTGSFFKGDGAMYEIRNGNISNRVWDNGIQFGTQKLWKSLVTLGDKDTVRSQEYYTYKGNPWKFFQETTTAPAGMFKDVDIIATGRSR